MNIFQFQLTLTDKMSGKDVMTTEYPFCDFFEKVFQLFPTIKESSNLDGSCPTTGVYTIDDVTLEDKFFSRVPPGEYELNLEVVDTSSKKTLVETETIGMFKF